jgi:hypothetical protein
MPVDDENRAITGVEADVKCCAFDSVAASAVGVKVPFKRRPLA